LTTFVVLTDVEKSWVTQWATAVYDATTAQNLVDTAINTDIGAKGLDVIGFSGELAFAKIGNHFPVTLTDGPTQIDCVVNGVSVDVKTTPVSSGHLVVQPKYKGKSAQAFVLMTGTLADGFHYRGWMWAEDVFQEKYIKDENTIPRFRKAAYGVPQCDLNQGLPA